MSSSWWLCCSAAPPSGGGGGTLSLPTTTGLDTSIGGTTKDELDLDNTYYYVVKRRPSLAMNPTKLDKHLVCDDSSFNRLVLRRFLNIIGIEVDECSSAAEAIRMISANGEYSVVWTDFALGARVSENDINGAELTDQLRNDFGYTGAVIVVSGFTDSHTRFECARNGVDHFLPKPLDRARVREYAEKYARVRSGGNGVGSSTAASTSITESMHNSSFQAFRNDNNTTASSSKNSNQSQSHSNRSTTTTTS